MSVDEQKIKITWDDVERVEEATPSLPVYGHSQTRSWGTISPEMSNLPVAATTHRDSVLLKGWFYLGAAGLLGAFVAWAICEPSFIDGVGNNWGNLLLFPLMLTLMCVSFGTVESLVERLWIRAFLCGLASIGLGIVFGFIFNIAANIIFNILLNVIVEAGVESPENPVFWICRALAWAVFGVAGGLVFGIVSKSLKKVLFGMLGGAIGAAIGGLLFDPISFLTQGGEASRAVGMSIVGAGTGLAIGLVENALKDRWLYVSGGPLAGKQFILYQDFVVIGRSQSSTIYLFKDPSIMDQHATISHRAGKSFLTAYGPVVIGSQTLHSRMQHMLASGEILQIGRYTFTYAEKERTTKP